MPADRRMARYLRNRYQPPKGIGRRLRPSEHRLQSKYSSKPNAGTPIEPNHHYPRARQFLLAFGLATLLTRQHQALMVWEAYTRFRLISLAMDGRAGGLAVEKARSK